MCTYEDLVAATLPFGLTPLVYLTHAFLERKLGIKPLLLSDEDNSTSAPATN